MADLADLQRIKNEEQDTADVLGKLQRAKEPEPTGVDAALDIANRGIRQFGTGMRMGVAPTIGEPESAYEASARFAGSVLPLALATPLSTLRSVPPAVKTATGFVGKTTQGIRNFADDIAKFAIEHPKSFIAGEMAAGAGAGAGGYIAQEAYPDSDAAKVIGELTGGIVAGSPIAPTVAVLRAGGRVIQNLPIVRATLFKPRESRARARIERATESPEAAAGAMDQELLPGLTPAQKTGDRGLLELERSILESSDELRLKGDAQIQDMNDMIRESLKEVGGTGSFEATKAHYEAAQEHLQSLLDHRLYIAGRQADERIAKLKPGTNREQANRIARQEIEKALHAARTQETELYKQIPGSVGVPTISARLAVRGAKNTLGKAQLKDIPVEARFFLSPSSSGYLGKNTTLKEMRSLQSKLRETARLARANQQFNKARISNDVADAITDDIARAQSDEDIAGMVDTAVSFSRTLNDRFSRGATGTILRSAREGGPSIPENLTLETSLGSGPKAKTQYNQIKESIGENPEEFAGAVEDYMKDRFLRAAFRGDTFRPAAAENFLSQNQDLLTEFPSLRTDIEQAIQAQNVTSLMERQNNSIGARLRNPNISKAALVVRSEPEKLFSTIERSRRPGMMMTEVMNRVKKDETGEALEGLKSAYIDRLLQKAIVTRGETHFVSGHRMEDVLNPTIVSKLLTPKEQNRLKVIIETAKKMDLARISPESKEGIVGDLPGKISDTLARITAAQIGRVIAGKTGGGTVQTPGFFAKFAQDKLKKFVNDPASRLLTDAVQDEELFKALLLNEARAPREVKTKASRKLNAWVAGVAGDVGPMFDEEE